MHVCFLCNEYPPATHGGVGTFTQTMARALVRKGCSVTAIGVYSGHAVTEDDQGVRVVRLKASPLPYTGFLVNGFTLRRALKGVHAANPIDIIDGPELSFAILRSSLPGRKVIRMHGGHHFFATTLHRRPAVWRSWQERRSFRIATDICAVSRFVADTTRELLKLNGRPIEILHNSVDLNTFAPRPDINEEPGLIVFVGTVCEKKGIRQLVLAMPKVLAAVPHARLLVAGRDWKSPKTGESFKESLLKITSVDVLKQISFLGPVAHDSLPDLLARAQVCVYPSHMEALPVAWLEALAMGKPVVVGNTGPAGEIVQHNVSGLLCNPFEPESIAACIIQALTKSDFARNLGANARRRAVAEFAVDVMAERNFDFYSRIVAAAD